MRQDLHQDVLAALGPMKFREEKGWLRQGECPRCRRKSLWTRQADPWVLRCDRINRCGYEGHVKELFPDIFESWSDRFASSAEQPDHAAEQYLHHARGLRVANLRGAFSQETYFSQELREGTATVRFPIRDWGGQDPAKVVSWWERFIDRPSRFGKMKARFAPGKSYGGLWWAHPDDGPDVLAAAEELWLVEGVFDAAALREAGLAAVACLSSGNYPATALARLREAVDARKAVDPTAKAPRLVWALDSDRAGKAGIRTMSAKANEAGWVVRAAQIPQPARGKVDWNDLQQRDRLKSADLEDYRWRGDLLLADTPQEVALLLHKKGGRATFPFQHASRTWWANIDAEKVEEAVEILRAGGGSALAEEVLREQAAKKALRVSQIANCEPRPLYFQQDPLTDESWYFFRVDLPHDGPSAKNTFTPSQIAAPAEFKKRLLSISPLASFTGNAAQLDRLLEMGRERLRVVEAVGFVGYSREHRAYIFNDVAVKDGRIVELNDDDYFDLGHVSVKSVDRSVGLEIAPWSGAAEETAWVDDLWTAFGAKGLVTLAYWFGAFFAEQLRERQASFPFLELSGPPNQGKSTLIEFLWKLCGRANYEGFDPSKSTASARGRNFAQVANLPIVLMEGDRDDDTARSKKFDFDELKSLYNGRSTRSRGVKTGGNETYEPPFRGAVVIEQNNAVEGSEAILTRIVRLHFDGAGYNGETKKAAERLESAEIGKVSGFLLAAVRREREVLARIAEDFADNEAALIRMPDVGHRRVAKCHAQLMGCLDALRLVVKLPDERFLAARNLVLEMAAERKAAIAADHPVVEAFWEAYDYIGARFPRDGTDDTGFGPRENWANHSRPADLIAVNLPDLVAKAGELRLPLPDLAALKAHLRTSRSRRFEAIRDVNSARIQRTLHCWVFKKSARELAEASR